MLREKVQTGWKNFKTKLLDSKPRRLSEGGIKLLEQLEDNLSTLKIIDEFQPYHERIMKDLVNKLPRINQEHNNLVSRYISGEFGKGSEDIESAEFQVDQIYRDYKGLVNTYRYLGKFYDDHKEDLATIQEVD
jgi:hypothetical protein